MKPYIYRRIRRRTASHEAVNTNKEVKPEQQFFGDPAHEPFFKPAVASQQAAGIQRACADCEKEDKVQRAPEKKEEEKVMKKEEKKEEKLQRLPDKKEEEKKVQRATEKKEEEKLMKKDEKKEEEKIQKKDAATSASNTTATASNYIGSISGKGQAMDTGVRAFYENRIGADFSDVKIHTGKDAADSAKDINAQAYAYGKHIVFNEGKYQPETSEGKHLLAHELAHVVQQGAASTSIKNIQRAANFVESTPVYDINLAEQFVKAYTNDPDNEFGSTHPLINTVDLTASAANPIKVPAESDLSTTAVGNEFEAGVTTVPVNETSFHMRLPQKGLTKWTLSAPISNIAGLFQHLNCRISDTNIEVTGHPSNTAIITATHVHEGVHAQHIRAAHNDSIVKFDQFLTTRKVKAATEAESKRLLLTQISGMSQAMLSSFARAFSQKAAAFHGGASGRKGNLAIRNISSDCSKVEIRATN